VSSLKNKEICLISLKDLGTWCGGGTPSKQVSAYWDNGTIPWVSPKDMKVDHIRGAEDTITEKAVKESATTLLPAGSVLIVTRSGILRHTFPVAVTDVPVTINQDLKALVPSEGVDAKYVAFGLRAFSHDILHQCSKQGTTVNSIETKELLRFQIPLFSTEVQTRIVAEIEKQFSRLDEAVANLKRVKANLKRYKAAVLKAAVEGKLTEEWRRGDACVARLAETDQGEACLAPTKPIETGAELLERILAERRKAAGKGKYKEPVGPDKSGLPELPAGWVWANLGQLAWSVKDGPHYSPKYSDSGIPFISGGNIRPEGIDFSSTKFISQELHAELSQRCKPEYGDLLYTKGGTTGIARINTETRDFNVWVHVAVLKLVNSVEPFYLQHALNSTHCYKQSQQYTHGVGNQDLGLTRMVWITIPLPPLAEQKFIYEEIERHLSIIAGAEVQVDANLRRADRLRQSILKQAFSGQLVPQDPNDEPASVLLERIRVNVSVGATHASPGVRTEKTKRARHASPLRKPKPLPMVAETIATYGDAIAARVLAAMEPGREYARADLAEPLGLTTGQWNAAIQELKRVRKVLQTGEKRGARYELVKAGGGRA
jgi:type I restriction enzyme S subunit